ncbi:hypothetical protein [Methylobacterium pseudosasicola]|uniref:Uncharacterized protein n=1 Tax=Methylobacterium pseudosasicola TaxID=582667 RepID=A0A1I4PXG8_9HYPH|nr:hypothetical protein [Methylobacterium pseudosasicola]SFM32499.1 hypothetical protein SAMN05192568_102712 [Methylobacterium pseudosasicola]
MGDVPEDRRIAALSAREGLMEVSRLLDTVVPSPSDTPMVGRELAKTRATLQALLRRLELYADMGAADPHGTPPPVPLGTRPSRGLG